MYRMLIVLMSLAAQLLPAQNFNLDWIDDDARLRRSQAQGWTLQKGSNQLPVASGIDIRFHRLLLTLDPAVRFVTGSVSTYFILKSSDQRTITFDMHDSLKVTAIRYHGALLNSYIHQNNRITITLNTHPSPFTLHPSPFTLNPSPLDSIMVDYQGMPPLDSNGSFSLSTHNDVPVLYTLSEPYGARDWWPCSQDLNDKIDSVHLVITVPTGCRAAANGMLIAEQHCDDRSIYQWMHRHPVAAYLIGVAVTNYVYYSDFVPVENGKTIEILNYVYPEALEEVRSQTPMLIRPFQLFNKWFGLYPFADERYGHAQWNWGGGMEHQTMSFMGSFGYDLMVHELAHQWFGNFITCGSWGDIWLNEGFATYLTGLCYEHDQGGIYWEPFKRLSINRVLREPDGSVYCYDTTDIDRIFDARLSYSKGAMVLHMLRWEMGDEHFFQAMNNYLYDPKLANGYATTKDLIAHCEAVADTSFREFFNDWVYGEGYPTYEMVYRLNGGNEIELELAQRQSDPGVSFFEMDVPVVLYGKSLPGSEGTTSTGSMTVRLHHTHSGQVFRLNPGFKVDSVKFDPERWICTANPVVLNASELPMDKQVEIYPNPVMDELTIQLALPEEGLPVRIFNQKGQLMYSGRTSWSSSRIRIPMRNFPAGIYTVQVEGRRTVSIVKERL